LGLLATDARQFLVASPFSDHTKGRARLNSLELLRVPDKNRLGIRFVKLREHRGHLPAGYHPGRVDDEHSQVETLSLPFFHASSHQAKVLPKTLDDFSRLSAAMPEKAAPRTR